MLRLSLPVAKMEAVVPLSPNHLLASLNTLAVQRFRLVYPCSTYPNLL